MSIVLTVLIVVLTKGLDIRGYTGFASSGLIHSDSKTLSVLTQNGSQPLTWLGRNDSHKLSGSIENCLENQFPCKTVFSCCLSGRAKVNHCLG